MAWRHNKIMLRAIPGFYGYFVDDAGHVWTRKRRGFAAKKGPVYPPRRLKESPRSRTSPYVAVGLYDGETGTTRNVHELVCLSFHGPKPDTKHEVRHLDGDARNNRPSNLEWSTTTTNQRDRLRHGTDMRGEKHPGHKLTNTDALDIKMSSEPGVILAERYCVSTSLVSAIKTGKAWPSLATQ